MTKPFDLSRPEWARLRAAAGLSQAALAAMLGLSGRNAVSRLEIGTRGQGRPNLAAWTLALLLTDQHPTLQVAERAAGREPG